jgi:hypothetical protein
LRNPVTGRCRLKAVLRVLESSAYAQAPAVFILIILVKWPVLGEPPVWDTAMGLFPAALTLAGNDFDLMALLRSPGYLDGGANTHSLSLVTLLTAVVLSLFGSGTKTFAVLHLLHFLVAAVALVTLQRFARGALGASAAWLLCLAVLLFPLFSVQVGYTYMEVPLFLCAVSALRSWDLGKYRMAILWSALALAVKEAGIIVPATLVVLTMIENRGLARRVGRAVWVVVPSAAWLGLTFLLNAMAASPAGADVVLLETFEFGGLGRWLHYLRRFLFNIPDLLAFIIIFLIGSAVWCRQILGALRLVPTGVRPFDPDTRRLRVLGISGVLIACFLAFFFLVLPVAVDFTIVLPRYYVMILPFLLLWMGFTAQRVLRNLMPAPALTLFVFLCAMSIMNSNGRFYPSDVNTEGPGNDFPLTERSNAYVRLNRIQERAIGYLETMPEDVTLYYGHYEHYLFTYPQLGYASGPLSGGHNLYLEDIDESILRDTERGCFYVLYNYPWLGGEKMLAFFAKADAGTSIVKETVREFREGNYVIRLIRIRNLKARCPTQDLGE